MKIDIPLSCPICSGKMYSINYESFLTVLKKKEVGKYVKIVILKEIQKNLKKIKFDCA